MQDGRPAGTALRLIAAPFTAFGPDGSLDLGVVPAQAERLRADGVAGAFVCGTTGQGAALTLDERRQVAEAWASHAEGLDVIVHVGHACLADAQALAAHAAGLPISGIAAVAPYYHRPADLDDLVRCCARLAAAAPETPFFYYHIPSMTQVALPMAEFLVAARERIPTFAGVKFTHDDLDEFARCLELAAGSVEVMSGRDELLLPSLVLGGSAAVGSTYNFAAPLYRELARALGSGDLPRARRAQRSACRMIEIAAGYGGPAAFKAVAAMVAVDCGPCREPIRTLDEGQRRALRDDLERAGFFADLDAARSAAAREPTARP